MSCLGVILDDAKGRLNRDVQQRATVTMSGPGLWNSKQFCRRLAVVVLVCLAVSLAGCDDGNPDVAPTVTLTLTPSAIPNSNLEPEAVLLLVNAARVANNLKSYRITGIAEGLKNYRYRFVREPEVQSITDVVAPDRCRTYHRRGPQPDTILVGKSLYVQYVHEGVGDSYFEDNKSNYATCTPGFTGFEHALPTLIEARILGDDNLEGHEVVRLRYNF